MFQYFGGGAMSLATLWKLTVPSSSTMANSITLTSLSNPLNMQHCLSFMNINQSVNIISIPFGSPYRVIINRCDPNVISTNLTLPHVLPIPIPFQNASFQNFMIDYLCQPSNYAHNRAVHRIKNASVTRHAKLQFSISTK